MCLMYESDVISWLNISVWWRCHCQCSSLCRHSCCQLVSIVFSRITLRHIIAQFHPHFSIKYAIILRADANAYNAWPRMANFTSGLKCDGYMPLLYTYRLLFLVLVSYSWIICMRFSLCWLSLGFFAVLNITVRCLLDYVDSFVRVWPTITKMKVISCCAVCLCVCVRVSFFNFY